MSASRPDASPGLQQTLGGWQVLFYGLGSMLGAGIYALIGRAAESLGNAVWLAFLAALVAAILTGLSYACVGSRHARAGGAARAAVADLGHAAHLAGDQHQGFVEQAAAGEVLEKGREGLIELRQQVLAQAVEVVAVRVPAAGALAARGDAFILLPEHRHERHAGFDQAAGGIQTRVPRQHSDLHATPVEERVDTGNTGLS